MWQSLIITMHLLSFITNVTTITFCLQRKKSLPFTIISFIVVFFLVLLIDRFTENLTYLYIPNGLAFLPIMIFLFKGNIYQKCFSLFMQMFVSLTIILFFSMTFGFFLPYGSNEIYISMFISTTLFFSFYLFLIFKKGKHFLSLLYGGGTKTQWLLYMLTSAILYTIVYLLNKFHIQDNLLHYGMLIFVMWSFVIFCYAIINTHEKTKQKYEADFAKGIISSGESHYQKMNNLLTDLKILRHDFKYHQRIVKELLQNGDSNKAIEYLGGVQKEMSAHELDIFCENQIINSLLTWYAQRCKMLKISYVFNAVVPEKLSAPDYDLCIIIGNLLENALEAVSVLKENKNISLNMMIHNEQFILKVENVFTDNAPQKQGGGLGLSSVQMVTERYKGNIVTKTNENVFTVSVLIPLEAG